MIARPPYAHLALRVPGRQGIENPAPHRLVVIRSVKMPHENAARAIPETRLGKGVQRCHRQVFAEGLVGALQAAFDPFRQTGPQGQAADDHP